jgi:hypothetical protein
MKSYKVRVMVEIEVPVHFNQDPRFEGPFDATRTALAQIETKIDGADGGPRLTGTVGAVTVSEVDFARPHEGTCPCGHGYSQHVNDRAGVANYCNVLGCNCPRFR